MPLNIAIPAFLTLSFLLLVLWLVYGINERPIPELVVSSLPRLKRCSVVLDGLVNAGKTCLVERIVSPHIPFRKLSASERVIITESWPIGFRRGMARRELYCANFIDIPGDSTREFAACVGNIREDEMGILVIVISAEQVESAIARRLTRDYIQTTYAPAPIKQRIRGVIIFLNKMDTIYASLQQQTKIDEYKQKINASLLITYQALNEVYPERVRVTFGSVKTNEGVLDLLGNIYELSGIANDTEQMQPLHETLMIELDGSDMEELPSSSAKKR